MSVVTCRWCGQEGRIGNSDHRVHTDVNLHLEARDIHEACDPAADRQHRGVVLVLQVRAQEPGVGFGVWGLGFGVWGLGFGVWGLGFMIWN